MTLDLSTLDGTNGFRINGIDAYDESGTSVSAAGDINGDGIDDLIIGAPSRFASDDAPGDSFVVFGTDTGFTASLDLSALDGSNGFRLAGVDPNDLSGRSVSAAGDINGDGIDDLIIGAPNAGENYSSVGESYVVFGSDAGFDASLELSTLDGSNGFRLAGSALYGSSGFAVSGAGDVNGDGFDDVIIGAPFVGPGYAEIGESFVVFGTDTGFSASIDLAALDGTNGFRINGIADPDQSGRSVAGAGDINGDGFDDVIIGAPNSGDFYAYDEYSGESYVVFGTNTGFAPEIDLSALDGTNGFRVEGSDEFHTLGYSVSGAGDVSGDGFDDVIIAAPGAGDYGTGENYVIFGTDSGFAASFDLAALNGTNGFRIDGEDDASGRAVSGAGDVNGDGFDDLIIGAPFADSTGNSDGESYLVLGAAAFAPVVELATIDGDGGLSISGIDDTDRAGSAVSGAGDVNGDGFDDVIIGAPDAEGGSYYAGESYVVFGSALIGGTEGIPEAQDDIVATGVGEIDLAADNGNGADSDPSFDDLAIVEIDGQAVSEGDNVTLASGVELTFLGDTRVLADAPNDRLGQVFSESFTYKIADPGGLTDQASVDLSLTKDLVLLAALDGSDGFRIDGIDADDESGRSVSAAGDVNGDGIGDVIIGAPNAGSSSAGESYVVFGTALGFTSSIDLATLDGTDGFVLPGGDAGAFSGASVSTAGDVNGDGIDDLIIGAPGILGYDQSDGIAGQSFVVFGSSEGFGSSLDLLALDGSNGFRIEGIDERDGAGSSVAAAGDINGDGIGDVIIGAPGAAGNGNEASGESYVVFGSDSGFPASLDLSDLDGSNGFRIDGIEASDTSGTSVALAGDINGDGFDDVIVGAPFGGPGIFYAGESYLVFGGQSFAPSLDLSALDGSNGFQIAGVDNYDRVGISVSGAGDINGDGIDDVIVGADSSSAYSFDAGSSYVVFGSSAGFSAILDVSSLDGANGFRIVGTDTGDVAGRSVSAAGDINGDGFDDVIVGAPGGDAGGRSSGESYIVFGSNAGFAASIDVSALDGTEGFLIAGVDEYDISGTSVSAAGDINGDGIDDVIIGAPNAGADSTGPGASFVLFGFGGGAAPGILVELIDADTDEVIQTLEDGDVLAEGALAGRNVTIAATVPEDGSLGGQVESVVLDLNDGQRSRTENAEPYALFGDNTGTGNFFKGPAGFALPTGANTISFGLFEQNGGRGLIDTVEIGFTITPTPDPVTARVDADGAQRFQRAVDTLQIGPDTDVEFGRSFTAGLLFDDVLIADGAVVAQATLTLTSERAQSGVDLDVEIGLFGASEGVGLAGRGALINDFDFFSTEQLSGSFAADDDVMLDVTSSVAGFLADQQGANTDGTFDFLFSLTSADGIFRVNPEEAGPDLAAQLSIEFA